MHASTKNKLSKGQIRQADYMDWQKDSSCRNNSNAWTATAHSDMLTYRKCVFWIFG